MHKHTEQRQNTSHAYIMRKYTSSIKMTLQTGGGSRENSPIKKKKKRYYEV